MKKAFTLLEVVFVIVVVGILSIVIMPRMVPNNLQDAATQVVSHIRYAQHLAMSNDKYNPQDVDIVNNDSWFEKRWRLEFFNGADTQNRWSYTVYDDSTDTAGDPDPNEIAVNPVNKSKKLTGGNNGVGMIHTGDPEATSEMNIGLEYNILDVDFSAACRTAPNSQTITFDHLGRPIRGATDTMISAYDAGIATNNLISDRCQIDLCEVADCTTAAVNQKISIIIEPETGYTCVLDRNGNCSNI